MTPRATRPSPTPAASRSAAALDRAAITLWIALAGLALLRAGAPLLPGMALWSLNLARFLAPAWAWAPWAIAAAALIPALSRGPARLAAGAGDALARGGAGAAVVAALVPLALVALIPDRTWFLGDFQLRQSTLEGARGQLPFWYPYCLPLDLFLHDTLARAMMARFDLIANDAGRIVGAIEAALLGVAAARFARATGTRGAAALTAWATIVFGGTLTLFTGYGKAFSEMTLAMVAAGVCVLEIARGRATLLALGVLIGATFFLHRSALGFVPGLAVAAALAWGTARAAGSAARARTITGASLALIALAVALPHTLAIVRRIDGVHFQPADVRRLGLVRATLAPGRALDLVNALVTLVPLAIPAMLAAGWAQGSLGARREWLALGALVLPFVVVAPFVHPTQGLMRDWDTLAAAAMGLALLTALALARLIDARPGLGWLALAATLATVAPTLQWMAHFADRDRGLERVEALLAGPPQRAAHERASAWEFLGTRRVDLGDLDRGATAFEREAAIEPSPQTLRHWATLEALRGNLGHARAIYRDLLRRDPVQPEAWLELAMLAAHAGDRDEARRAAGEALRLDPGRAEARALLEAMGPEKRAR